MRSAKRRASKTDVKKNRVYSPPTSVAPSHSPPQRLVPGVDYSRMTPVEIRRLGQLRLERWKSPSYFPPDTPLIRIQQGIAQARSRSEAPPPNVNVNQSTPRSSSRPGSEKNDFQTAIECVGRKIRRQLVFSFGSGGSTQKYPDRKPPSKVKC